MLGFTHRDGGEQEGQAQGARAQHIAYHLAWTTRPVCIENLIKVLNHVSELLKANVGCKHMGVIGVYSKGGGKASDEGLACGSDHKHVWGLAWRHELVEQGIHCVKMFKFNEIITKHQKSSHINVNLRV